MNKILLFIVACHLVSLGHAYTCEEETFLGITISKTCPGPRDDRDAQYCCGPKDNRRCCDTPFGLDDELIEDVAKQLPKIIGAIVVGIIVLMVACVLCCCCCPFCLLFKRRNKGTIHQPQQMVEQPQQASAGYAPVQNAQYPPAAPYPTQAGYPQAAAPYPTQAGYPQAAAPYPTQPGYPTQPSYDQPPAYSEKQQAFNPGY